MRTEDGSLVADCLNGDPVAFGLLVDKYKASIYALAYSRLNNFHDAEDVTQEAFLTAYRKLRKLRRWESFAKWLYTITINLCKNLKRRNVTRPDRELIEDQNSLLIDSRSIESYQDKQIFASLHDALDSLPEIYQQVLLLHYLGGMTSYEIAESLGISSDAVRQRLTRGRNILRDDMLASMAFSLQSKKLNADFTFRIVEAVKRIKANIIPKQASLPLSISAASIILTFTFLSIFPSINLVNISPKNSFFLQNAKKVKAIKDEEYLIPIEVIETDKPKISYISNTFDDGDVSDWEGGYYTGEIDLDEKNNGIPIIEASSDAAKSGSYGLVFTKDRDYGTSTMASSPEFGPFLLLPFQVGFDIILFDYRWHIIQLGENAPFETNDEATTINFGIGFDKGLISLRAEGFPQIGKYVANEFYYVKMVADPATDSFSVTIKGKLFDLEGNRLNQISINDLKFEKPISGIGIRRVNLYTGAPSVNSMGLDNLVINPVTDDQAPILYAGDDATINEGEIFISKGYLINSEGKWTAKVDYGEEDGKQNLWLRNNRFKLIRRYEDDGNFTVKVRLKSNDNKEMMDKVNITVKNVAPKIGKINISNDPNQSGKINVIADFTDPGVLDTHTAIWNWGDGSTSYGIIKESKGSGTASGSHEYKSNNEHKITLKVTDKDGKAGVFVTNTSFSDNFILRQKGNIGEKYGMD